MTTLSQISLECQPPVAISDPQPDTTPLNHLPGGSSTVTPTSSQTQEGVSSYLWGLYRKVTFRTDRTQSRLTRQRPQSVIDNTSTDRNNPCGNVGVDRSRTGVSALRGQRLATRPPRHTFLGCLRVYRQSAVTPEDFGIYGGGIATSICTECPDVRFVGHENVGARFLHVRTYRFWSVCATCSEMILCASCAICTKEGEGPCQSKMR